MTIELRPEIESRLRVEAQRQGVDAQALALRLIEATALSGVDPQDLVVATSNVAHLLQFLHAQTWDTI